jgi:ribosomal protein S18 acetylase RimI-like enzyme
MPRANHRAELGPLYVIPDAQGKGAAKALIDVAFASARDQAIWQIELDVNEENARAISFYKRLGFHQAGRIPNAMIGADGPEHDLIFLLHLAPA